jgi:outer membrane receptor protein involved in Fe transport
MAALFLGPGMAVAQGGAGSLPTAPVQGVTVTAPSQAGPQVSIDRRSYDISKDLTSSGTVADALRDVPSVSVDAAGNVSLGGDPNVVILVDGRPSTLFQGPNRAQMLQQLPADAYERVEVIANPTAALSPEGTGGVINLVTRKTHAPGASAQLRANADVTGRWNGTLSASETAGKASLTLDAGVRHGFYERQTDETQVGFAADGQATFSNATHTGTIGHSFIWNVRGALDYDPDAATRLSAALHYLSYFADTGGSARTVGDDSDGDLDLIFNRDARTHLAEGDAGLDASAHHSLGGDAGDVDLSLAYDRADASGAGSFLDTSLLPPAARDFDGRNSNDVTALVDAKAEYQRPMPRGAKLTAGYELKLETDAQGHAAFEGAAAPVAPPDPAFSERFHFDRHTSALYATYEQPLGKLTVLPGLRVEQSEVTTAQVAAGAPVRTGDLHAYPSLHLSYALGDGQTLSASYSERINRPIPQYFDPYQNVVSPFESSAGNPLLRPEQSENFELAWDRKDGADYLRAGLFFKSAVDGLAQAVTPIGPGDFLSTYQSLVASQRGGAQMEADGQLAPRLSYNVSSQVFWTRMDAFDLGLAAPRSALSAYVQGELSWRPTPADTLQLDATAHGPTLTAEGAYLSWARVALGYRHRFDDRLSFLASLQDALATDRYGFTATTPLLAYRLEMHPHSRVLFLGLAYAFGGAARRDAPLDLGGESSPVGP